jgi:hypothetical protein
LHAWSAAALGLEAILIHLGTILVAAKNIKIGNDIVVLQNG